MGRKCLDKNKRGNKYIRLLNEDNWEKGWLVKIEATGNNSEQNDLLEYEDYKEELE